jgi:hypothetical protein
MLRSVAHQTRTLPGALGRYWCWLVVDYRHNWPDLRLRSTREQALPPLLLRMSHIVVDAINKERRLATKSDETFGIRRFRSIGEVPTDGLRPLGPLAAVSVRSSGWPNLPT